MLMLKFAVLLLLLLGAFAQAEDDEAGFSLKPLPYAFNALEPAIDAETMELHWSRHHRTYLDNTNAALKSITAPSAAGQFSPKLRATAAAALAKHDEQKLEEAIRLARGELDHFGTLSKPVQTVLRQLRNHGGGFLNHNQYWGNLTPKPSPFESTSPLAKAILQEWKTESEFQAAFVQQGMSVFGSGWVWLAYCTRTHKLVIETTPNQDRLPAHYSVVLAVDTWEHAHYLKYRNLRIEYLKALWQVTDWKSANARYQQAVAEDGEGEEAVSVQTA